MLHNRLPTSRLLPLLLLLLLLPLLPLLVLPALALAQIPTAPWSQNLATCTPDEGATPYFYLATNSVTVRPGTVTPLLPGPFGRSPLLVRCAIHGPGASQVKWNWLELVAHDPDGAANASRLKVELKRQRLPTPDAPPAVRAETVRVWDSRNRPSPDRGATFRIGIGATVFHFDTHTYWLEVHLFRLDPLVLPPRAYLVRLRWVD